MPYGNLRKRLRIMSGLPSVLMKLHPAAVGDAPDLVRLRDRLAEWLLSRGIEQWQPGQIGVERLAAWIEAGLVFVHRKDGEIAAAVTVLWNDPLIWGPDDGNAGYVHMLMVDRRWSGHDLGGRTLTWSERHIRRHQKHLARLDVTASNPALQNWYMSRGYEAVGSRQFDHPGWNATVLLEKTIPTAGAE